MGPGRLCKQDLGLLHRVTFSPYFCLKKLDCSVPNVTREFRDRLGDEPFQFAVREHQIDVRGHGVGEEIRLREYLIFPGELSACYKKKHNSYSLRTLSLISNRPC